MSDFLVSRRFYAFAVAVLLLGAAWTIQSRVPLSDAAGGQLTSPREGFPAPEFTLEDFQGAPLASSSLRGQVVVINVWTSWCGPCRAEMPALERVYIAEKSRGLVVLGVNSTIQDNETDARGLARELGITFPLLLDRDGAVTSRYRVRALPTTFIVDRRGIIRSVMIGGPLAEAALRSKINALLAEP
ncbi:MAG: TlpA family protein disulfide reductase [Anaerolineae bacterium]|nr:TlpA family protein disulfide reductase [Anaerolineae bacterium]